jgi:RNA polymerase sigma-70 factor (ECF subfamily)
MKAVPISNDGTVDMEHGMMAGPLARVSARTYRAPMDAPLGQRSAPDETGLIAALRAEEAWAYEHVMREHGRRLLPVARRILGSDSDAEDAFQDAMLSAFRSMNRFDGRSKFGTWLHRIVVNSSLMKLRSRRRRPERPIDDLLPRFADDGHRIDTGPLWTTPPSDAIEQREVRDAVLRRIEELPVDSRNVLVLRDIEGVDTSEAARQLGISPGAVKTRLHRARQALRTLLEQEFRP